MPGEGHLTFSCSQSDNTDKDWVQGDTQHKAARKQTSFYARTLCEGGNRAISTSSTSASAEPHSALLNEGQAVPGAWLFLSHLSSLSDVVISMTQAGSEAGVGEESPLLGVTGSSVSAWGKTSIGLAGLGRLSLVAELVPFEALQ